MCIGNNLSQIDLTDAVSLEELYCSSNQLTSLDVSNCSSLKYLNCTDNPYLTEIWLKTGQTIDSFSYDTAVATIKYKD